MNISDSKFTLYHYPGVRSARIKWILNEITGIKFNVVTIDLYDAEQYGDSFSEINPSNAVPVLKVDDGKNIFFVRESGAITIFIADCFPAAQLSPSISEYEKRADFLQMIFFACSTFDMALWQIRIHTHVLSAADRDSRVAGLYARKIKEQIEPQIIERLKKYNYICGDFSAADCVFGHCILWAKSYSLCEGDVFDNYISRLSSRGAFKSAFSDAHLFKPEVPNDSPALKRFLG
ncbi:Glutathione S-transferase-like protein (plasmid) [Pseudomonas antarctica]|uniref:Glutathione S-transferase-like protein n=1 Tax=Pseudomonas antarctica TaxID=219572 RepID=A0A172Z9W2_9PSED|nr:glutathione S-transferase family protein [Pseudomonas antarctica]ANF89294.1 Glutathione S-transferase-like protein [Pseudomonas antarctica]